MIKEESQTTTSSIDDQKNITKQEIDQERNSQKNLEAKILQQVEYYFSDDNLLNDDFLVRQMAKNQEAYVRISVITKFKKMQKMKTDVGTIMAILAKSQQLQISPDGQMIRRVGSIPQRVLFEKKTVVAGNLPKETTRENLKEQFGQWGTVEEIEWPVLMTDETKKTDVVAYLRFQTEEQALLAIEKMNDTNNWRNGLRVRHKGQSPSLAPNKRWKTHSSLLPASSKSKDLNSKEVKDAKEVKEFKENKEIPNAGGVSNDKKANNRRRNKSRSVNSVLSSSPPSRQTGFGSSSPPGQSFFTSSPPPSRQQFFGQSSPQSVRQFAVSPPGLTSIGFMPTRQPLGPDGTKGFCGRGRPLAN